MYVLIILFFGSLLGIIFMLGRKFLIFQNGEVLHFEEVSLDAPLIEKWKDITIRNAKKHGYNFLVVIVRLYVRGTNLLKNKYQEIKIKIINMRSKKLSDSKKREVSGFLKMISEYKQKIRNIKHQIKEEENL